MAVNNHFVELSPKERNVVFNDLTKSSRPIQIQITGQGLRQAKTTEKQGSRIYFSLPHLQKFDGQHEAIITFSLPPEVFFIKTVVTREMGQFFFTESAVYRLQRRDNFRLSISGAIPTSVMFHDFNRRYPLYDVSVGGFSIEAPPLQKEEFPKGSSHKVSIEMDVEQFSNIQAEVKHCRLGYQKKRLIVGFEFRKLTQKNEARLLKLITDIARIHFRR